VSGGCYALPTQHRTGNALQNFVKTINQSLKHKEKREVTYASTCTTLNNSAHKH